MNAFLVMSIYTVLFGNRGSVKPTDHVPLAAQRRSIELD